MQKYMEACDSGFFGFRFFLLAPTTPTIWKGENSSPRITPWWFILAIIPCSTKHCFLVYYMLAHSGGKTSGSLSSEFSTGLTLKSYSWWELASIGGKTVWMGREILCPSDNIFWGDHLAFCMHHLQQHKVGQRPPAFRDEVATMFSPSPKGIRCLSHRRKAAMVGKQRRDLTRKWTILWTIYKWQMNPWWLSCTHID